MGFSLLFSIAMVHTAWLSWPYIDLYTMGQGEQLFARFGHAAVCVVDKQRLEQAVCYNYGTTDFGSPPAELGWDFLRGKARFWVSVWPLGPMLRAYAQQDRTVWRQRLPLDEAASAAFAAKLAWDAKKENRYYLYHHFDDNCSTRVRDIIDEVSGGILSARGAHELHGVSYRSLARQGVAEKTHLLALSDLFLGRRADNQINQYDAMFMPSVLRASVEEYLGAKPVRVYARTGSPFPQQLSSGRIGVLLSAFAVAIALVLTRRCRRLHRLLWLFAGSIIGTIGCIVWGVAAMTTVTELRINEVVLLFWPLDAALGVLRGKCLTYYIRLRFGVSSVLMVLLATGLLVQPILPLATGASAVFGAGLLVHTCFSQSRKKPCASGVQEKME